MSIESPIEPPRAERRRYGQAQGNAPHVGGQGGHRGRPQEREGRQGDSEGDRRLRVDRDPRGEDQPHDPRAQGREHGSARPALRYCSKLNTKIL